VNPGAYPLDPSTPVGQLRAQLGDTEGTELSPPVTGQRNYAVFSDAVLAAYLAAAGDNLLRAAGNAVQTIAIVYSQQGKTQIKADDLGLTISDRGQALSDIAASFFRQADAAAAADVDDLFLVAPLGGRLQRDEPCLF
jgi:hypothetical protein